MKIVKHINRNEKIVPFPKVNFSNIFCYNCPNTRVRWQEVGGLFKIRTSNFEDGNILQLLTSV